MTGASRRAPRAHARPRTCRASTSSMRLSRAASRSIAEASAAGSSAFASPWRALGAGDPGAVGGLVARLLGPECGRVAVLGRRRSAGSSPRAPHRPPPRRSRRRSRACATARAGLARHGAASRCAAMRRGSPGPRPSAAAAASQQDNRVGHHPCASRTRAYARQVTWNDHERLQEHEKPRAPEQKPVEDPAAPLHELVSNVGNRAFGGAIARSQGAGHHAERRGPSERAVDDRLHARRRHRPGPRRLGEAVAVARRPLGCPRPHRSDRARPQSRGVRARVRDRHRRLLRAGPVQAQHHRTATS